VGTELVWLIRKQSRMLLAPILQHCHCCLLLHLSQLTIALRKKRMQPKEEGKGKMIVEK
jgi:hypothetical protein